MKRIYWLIFAGLGIIVAIDIATKFNYTLTFALLGLLYLIAIPGGLLLQKVTRGLYDDRPWQIKPLKQGWRWGLSLIFFAIMAVLTTLRKATVSLPIWLTLTIIGVALSILLVELHFDWHLLPQYKFRLLSRGFLVSLVLLFNGFFAYFYLGKTGMYVVFAIYLLGLETGYPLFHRLGRGEDNRARDLSLIGVVVGQALLLIPWIGSYLLGMLLIALYVGYDNPTINATLYGLDTVDSDTAMVHKYRFSTYGGLLCQLGIFGLLVTLSAITHRPLLAFFNPQSAGHFALYFYGLNCPLVIISLLLTSGTIWVRPRD